MHILNKGMHSHEPPRKNNFTRESKSASSAARASHNVVTAQPITIFDDSDPSTSSKESVPEITVNPERKRPCSSGSDGNGDVQVREELLGKPEPRKRMKKGNAVCSDSVLKAWKKSRFVVHAAGDVGISGDGYRWRKYGQKMVKGNPNPRCLFIPIVFVFAFGLSTPFTVLFPNQCEIFFEAVVQEAVFMIFFVKSLMTDLVHPSSFFDSVVMCQCTSAGCPVRKHIETAVDNTNGVIITYKSVHDHDMPVPKKRHGQPSAPLVAAAAPASMINSQLKNTDGWQSQVNEGELTGEALNLGGKKAIESARTLLSIGFEIKQC